MNTTKTLIAAAFVALMGANAASAQEAIPATWANEVAPHAASTTTRAQVKAELAVARANGELSTSSDNYGTVASVPFVSTKSRAEVKSETLHAMAAGAGLSQGDRTGG
jgi:hypothetical protein